MEEDKGKFNPCEGSPRTRGQVIHVILADLYRRVHSGEIDEAQADAELRVRAFGESPVAVLGTLLEKKS